MASDLVVPVPVAIEPSLERLEVARLECGKQPDLEGAEEPFDFAIERRATHAAEDVLDFQGIDLLAESLLELPTKKDNRMRSEVSPPRVRSVKPTKCMISPHCEV
jgi:hypothetical protein